MWRLGGWCGSLRCRRCCGRRVAFVFAACLEQLLQFAAIEPDAVAFRAHVEADALSGDFLHSTVAIGAHEQGHFDIAEIFARRLNKQMSEYVFNKNTFKDDLKKIYMSLTSEKDSFQNRYDEETNHSINKEKQSEWLKKIEGFLKELKAFSNY